MKKIQYILCQKLKFCSDLIWAKYFRIDKNFFVNRTYYGLLEVT